MQLLDCKAAREAGECTILTFHMFVVSDTKREARPGAPGCGVKALDLR